MYLIFKVNKILNNVYNFNNLLIKKKKKKKKKI